VIRGPFSQLVCRRPKNERALTPILTKSGEDMTPELPGVLDPHTTLADLAKQDQKRVAAIAIPAS
jgi:hypothetical protein